MTILRQLARGLLATGALIVTACSGDPITPAGPVEAPAANLLTGSIDALPSGGTSNTVMAKAVSPRGWVLGVFYQNGLTVRAQAWSPGPDYVVGTVTDTGSVYSAADEHGDVTAVAGSLGPVVYVAEYASGGAPYAVAQLPLPPDPGVLGNWQPGGLNDSHIVVGGGPIGPVVWVPTATGATTWLDPFTLPLPGFPLGINAAEAAGVNSSGLIVGTVQELLKRGLTYHAWLWRVEQMNGAWTTTSLGELPWAPGASDQAASDVNDSGVIVGWVRERGDEHAAFWYPDAVGNYTQPPTVHAVAQWNATHVNRCGWTVSTLMSGKGRTGGVVAWNGVEVVSLPLLEGSSDAKAFDINDEGIVAGASIFKAKGRTPTTHMATVWRDFVPPCPP